MFLKKQGASFFVVILIVTFRRPNFLRA